MLQKALVRIIYYLNMQHCTWLRTYFMKRILATQRNWFFPCKPVVLVHIELIQTGQARLRWLEVQVVFLTSTTRIANAAQFFTNVCSATYINILWRLWVARLFHDYQNCVKAVLPKACLESCRSSTALGIWKRDCSGLQEVELVLHAMSRMLMKNSSLLPRLLWTANFRDGKESHSCRWWYGRTSTLYKFAKIKTKKSW